MINKLIGFTFKAEPAAQKLQFIEASKIEITETVHNKRKLQREDALKLLKRPTSLQLLKARKLAIFRKRKTSEDAVAMLGSTGNLRAPTAVVGKNLLVGFNEEAYQSVFA